MIEHNPTKFDPQIFRDTLAAVAAGRPADSADAVTRQFHYQMALDSGYIAPQPFPQNARITYDGQLFLDETQHPVIWNALTPVAKAYGMRAAERMLQHIIAALAEREAAKFPFGPLDRLDRQEEP